ncbi:MAG: hypothetical protein A2Z20_02035 [Bdellovibrionales bacterium RBG_16_40_8]|nr:MAG: hypothetical protein A2Z20_02035 [Bdellovibrionales bacterium RBG_16_40_8]
MRLEVTGRRQLKDRVRLTYVYQNNRRYGIDENGVKRVEKTSDDFFEPYFHFRFSKNIKPMLVSQNIAPAISLRSESHRYSENKPRPDPDAYTRLSRVGGTIAYAIGSPTPSSSTDLYPGIWIEQDHFVIRKLRLLSQLEISANQYKSYSNDLWLPYNRSIRWSGNTAKIQINSATPVAASPKVKTLLQSESLNFGENPNLSRQLSEDAIIKDFYSRLR